MYWMDKVIEEDGELIFYYKYFDILPKDLMMVLVIITYSASSLEDFLKFYHETKRL